MTALQVLFWIVAAVSFYAALMVVTRRNLVHAALFLVLAFLGVGVLFVLLEAGFWAVIQILIYIGAIAILMIFAVMLTRQVTDEETDTFNQNWGWAAVIGLIVFAGLVVTLVGWPQFWAVAPEADTTAAVVDLGIAFFSADAYLIPSLVASILLLAVLVGALVLAWRPQQKASEE